MIIQPKSNVLQLHAMNIKGKGSKGVIWGVGGTNGDHYKLVQTVGEAVAPEAEHIIVMFSGNVIKDMKIINEINPDVVNLSWTGLNLELFVQMYQGVRDAESNELYSDIVAEFFKHYNICAAGNSGEEEKLFPAADDRFLSVGACRYDSLLGAYVRKSYQTKNTNVDLINHSGYDIDNDGDIEEGTSFASPYTYGEALLLRSMKGRRLEFWEYNEYFKSICIPSNDEYTGWGCPEMEIVINTHVAEFIIGSKEYCVDGQIRRMNSEFISVPGTTYAPLRTFVELLNEFAPCTIDEERLWNGTEPTKVKLYITEM